MKVSDEMVERAAMALWKRATSDPWDGASEKFRDHYMKDARVALEASLYGLPFGPINDPLLGSEWWGKRVALVPLDD